MYGVEDWVRDLKFNKKNAEKYKGVETVKEILELAKKDGYDFTEKELLNFNLDLVAGGSGDFWTTFQFGNSKKTINKKTNVNKVNTTQTANVSMSANNDANQN